MALATCNKQCQCSQCKEFGWGVGILMVSVKFVVGSIAFEDGPIKFILGASLGGILLHTVASYEQHDFETMIGDHSK